MRRAIRAIALAAAGGLAATSAHAFTLENGTIWPLSVSIGGAQPQTVPAEEVRFLFRGQCPNGCTVNIAVADPLREQTLLGTVDGDQPAIQGNGDPVTVRVRQVRGGAGLTVEIVGDLASEVPTTAVGTPFSGSSPTPPALLAPPSPAPASPSPAPTPPAQDTPPGFLPPPPPPDY